MNRPAAAKDERAPLRPVKLGLPDVLVSDRAGKPVASELTLWAVDEGVLMLTGYATPDPIPTFTAPRSLAVFAMESRADLARIFRAAREKQHHPKLAVDPFGKLLNHRSHPYRNCLRIRSICSVSRDGRRRAPCTIASSDARACSRSSLIIA